MIDTRNSNNIVDVHYQQLGTSTKTNELGMREMQAKAYAQRNQRFLLVKAPPASGKSRALMFIALDKLANQGIKKVIVAVPEKSIGRSFKNTNLKDYGFFADWVVSRYFNLTDAGGSEQDKAGRFVEFLQPHTSAKILVCAHATLRNGMRNVDDSMLDGCLLAIDEFHHTSADASSGLGDIVRRVMNNTTGHIVAMTGSYFRGDGIPVLRAEDEARFYPVTYNYYQQLNGYKYLKNLVLGYHFYHGSYLEHISEVLDTTKKTIIHIPQTNSRAATGIGKYEETEQIMRLIGEEIRVDYNNNIHYIRTAEGRVVKVADLVDDDLNTRNRMQYYLQNLKRKDDVDIIIAMGTAKEGFDWQWCDMCLTIGVRGSLTEVIQIIGRCTRDCKGKETARFVNMISMPDAEQAEVKVAVNDFLKAITASLLMEQVMAPRWNFRTTLEDVDITDEPNVRTITVEGLKPLTTERTKLVVQEQLDDLKASVLQNDLVLRAISGSTTAETITKHLIPKVICERYPDWTPEEVEAVRQRLVLDMTIKGNDVVNDSGEPIDFSQSDTKRESEGNRLLKLTNKFINLDKLSINLIDTINPFQRAYEVVSKSVDAPTLKVIQDTIAEQKYDMKIDQAIALFPRIKEYVAEKGHLPNMEDANPQVRELAIAYAVIANQKRRKMMGLDYDPEA